MGAMVFSARRAALFVVPGVLLVLAMVGSTAARSAVAGPASSLTVAAPASSIAGQVLSVRVSAIDGSGKVDPTYTGTVALSTGDDFGVVVPTSYTLAAKDKGVHVFSVTLKSVGTETISASAGGGSLSGSATVAVAAGAATHFGVVPEVKSTVSGDSHGVTVTALNAYNQPVAGYTGTMHVSSSDTAATLPDDYTFGSSDKGVHVVDVTLRTAGSRTVTVKDTKIATIAGTATLTVTPGATSTLAVAVADTAIDGQPLPVTVKAVDAAGNVTPAYTGRVTLTSSD